MFCGELQRRLRSAGSTIDCMSAHPGISSTDIFRKEDKSKPSANVLNVLGDGVLARIQPPERGCHSMLYAATEPSLTGTCHTEQLDHCFDLNAQAVLGATLCLCRIHRVSIKYIVPIIVPASQQLWYFSHTGGSDVMAVALCQRSTAVVTEHSCAGRGAVYCLFECLLNVTAKA